MYYESIVLVTRDEAGQIRWRFDMRNFFRYVAVSVHYDSACASTRLTLISEDSPKVGSPDPWNARGRQTKLHSGGFLMSNTYSTIQRALIIPVGKL